MEIGHPAPGDRNVDRPPSAIKPPLRVLLVEDDKTDAELMLRALTRGGYDVTSARVDTEEQMRAELARAEWDIIIADYYLPTFDGMAALQLLQSTGREIPFILVSGAVTDETAVEVVRAGARDYIRKDQTARLAAAVRREADLAAARARHIRSVSSAPAAPRVQPRTGIATRLMTGFLAVTLVYGLMMGWIIISRLGRGGQEALEVATEVAAGLSVSVAKLDEKAGAPDVLFDDPTNLQELVEALAFAGKRDVEIVDIRKRIVADAVKANVGTTFTHDTGDEVGLTLRDGRPRAFVEKSTDYPAGIRLVAVPVRAPDGQIGGALLLDYTALYEGEMQESTMQIRWFALAGFLALAVASGVVWLTARSITHPLDQLRTAAHRVGRQELDAPIPAGRNDEVGELAAALEQMRLNLVTAMNVQKDEMQRRANVEESLSESNQALRTLIGTAPVAILHLNMDGIVRMWNPAAERMYGWHEREVVNRPLPGIPPDKRDEFAAIRERLLRGEIIAAHETTRLRKDGTVAHVALSVAPMRDAHGEVTGVISIAVDISERTRAEAALRAANAEITASMRALEDRTAELHLLRDMTDLIQSSADVNEAYEVTQRYLARLFPHETGAIYLFPPSLDVLEKTSAWGERASLLTPVFAPEECWAMRRGSIHQARASRGDALCRHTPAADGVERVCIPLLAHGETLGIIHFCRAESGASTGPAHSFLTLADTVASGISLSIGNLRLRERLRQQSIRDPLTGLFNRRYLDETLPREVLRATRAKATLGVMMLDIDHFKRFNDTHGHDAGDAVLSALGRFVQNQVRGDDIACRYGGEEFTLILPGASLEIVCERAEQLRAGAQLLAVRAADTQLETITLSLGVAVWPSHGETPDAVLQAADAALYRAKQAGRDRVEIAA